jgi:predicted enzyme related to lactoylglutathione lyase
MKATLFLNPTSQEPERLIEFYRNVVGLPAQPDMGPDTLRAGGASVGIDGHRDTAAATLEPSRFLLDFWVGDAAAERKRMEALGARFIRKEGVEEWGGIISTFVDPDGNYGQLMQTPAGGAPGEVSTLFLDITSEDPQRLLGFYRDIVGLEPWPEVGPNGLLVSEGAGLHFDTHSETSGPAKEPTRMIVNFFVEDVAPERERLEGLGVRFFRKEGNEFWGGVISSFLDPDGNIVQLMGYDPTKDTTSGAQG